MHGRATDTLSRCSGPSAAESARHRRPTPGQAVASVLLVAGLVAAFVLWPAAALNWSIVTGWVLFAGLALLRCAAIGLRSRPAALEPPAKWPRYTVVAALYREAAVASQLCERLARLDYPTERLEGFLALETDDLETRAAVEACIRPAWLTILVVPPGTPRTKPRALNWALAHATGELLTVYDAEDDPDPGQLKAAVTRFAASSPDLVCLQAPLRIRPPARSRSPLLDRQFAGEYAALFEVILPAFARLGLPFPLGGTSNHFRIESLRRIGGWDPWNVTEDADLGFRLWRRGFRLGVIEVPTWETPPGPFRHWLPQRTRWLKGYAQTLIVHLRRPWSLGARGLPALFLTVGAALVAAVFHAPFLAWIAVTALAPLALGQAPHMPIPGLAVLLLGWISATAITFVGARRAGIAYGLIDTLAAPFYWALTSLALVHALVRFISQPHAWDKTPHTPDALAEPVHTPLETGRVRLGSPKAAGHAAPLTADHADHPGLGRLRPDRQRRRA